MTDLVIPPDVPPALRTALLHLQDRVTGKTTDGQLIIPAGISWSLAQVFVAMHQRIHAQSGGKGPIPDVVIPLDVSPALMRYLTTLRARLLQK